MTLEIFLAVRRFFHKQKKQWDKEKMCHHLSERNSTRICREIKTRYVWVPYLSPVTCHISKYIFPFLQLQECYRDVTEEWHQKKMYLEVALTTGTIV